MKAVLEVKKKGGQAEEDRREDVTRRWGSGGGIGGKGWAEGWREGDGDVGEEGFD